MPEFPKTERFSVKLNFELDAEAWTPDQYATLRASIPEIEAELSRIMVHQFNDMQVKRQLFYLVDAGEEHRLEHEIEVKRTLTLGHL